MRLIDNSQRLRLQVFGAVVLICVQVALGMFVNLFVSIPKHHSGSQPSNYFSGSFHSVAWSVDHGAIALVLHVILGFLLALMVIGAIARAVKLGRGWITTWTVLGALFTIGAGFNGLSFLNYGKDASSFVMTVLALAALLCFVIVVYLPSIAESPETEPST
jgi:heme A synthase